MKSVFCLGLTPALQRTLLLNRFALGEENRTRQVVESASGDSIDTARALTTLGTPADAAGFNGGDMGKKLASLIKIYGVGNALTQMSAQTRVCTTVIDTSTKSVTQVIEEPASVDLATVKKMSADASKRLVKASMLVICGTLPGYVNDRFYVKFAQEAEEAGVPFLLDTHSSALLHTLPFHPLLAKMNLYGLGATFGRKMTEETDIEAAMRDLQSRGAANVLVTDGLNAGYLLSADGFVKLRTSKLLAAVNPIGCGACATGGFVHAILAGKSVLDAARFAMACGWANAETLLPADFSLRRANVLFKDTKAYS